MVTMQLTERESAIIEEHRKRAVEKIRQQRLQLKLLKIAADFEEWKQENGAGATYSTFCNDFGYEASEGEDRPRIYESAVSLIELAHKRAI